MSTPDLIDAFCNLIADKVAERIGARIATSSEYTSDSLPRDCPTRRAFAVACRRIPEASKHGRVWSVPRDVWAARRLRRQGVASIPRAEIAQPLNDRADELISRAGFRIIRTAR